MNHQQLISVLRWWLLILLVLHQSEKFPGSISCRLTERLQCQQSEQDLRFQVSLLSLALFRVLSQEDEPQDHAHLKKHLLPNRIVGLYRL